MNAVASGAMVALVAALGVALWRWTVNRRITTAADRLELPGYHQEDGPADHQASASAGSGPALGRLERVVAEAVRRADDAEASRSRLSAALEAVPQGVVLADERGREVFRNSVARAYTGARHGEALVEQVVRQQLAAATDGSTAQRNLDLFGPPARMLVVSSKPLDDGANGADGDDRPAAGGLVVIDDVSERRRLEAVRRDFVAAVSHELKTPVGALGLLAEAIASEDDPAVHQRLAERMTTEAHRMGRLIDDLLDLSRIEAEESPVRETVPVRQVVAEAVERVRPLSSARRIEIDVDDVDARHALRGDHRQLVSAVGNLLENACKYSDEGSTVEVRSRVDAEAVEIDVCDHGIGIPTRDLERVFERFYRVDRARSRETGGTGLGLAIVRHVASNHLGEVRVSSREGEGSVFTLRLPAGTSVTAVAGARTSSGDASKRNDRARRGEAARRDDRADEADEPTTEGTGMVTR